MKQLTDISDIKQLLEDCLKEFANKDFDLIGLGRERAISCKLAMIMHDIVVHSYDIGKMSVDAEYDRYLNQDKEIKVRAEQCLKCTNEKLCCKRYIDTLGQNITRLRIRPDIIFHGRKEENNNCFVIEVKLLRTEQLRKRVYRAYKYDYAKLAFMTCGRHLNTKNNMWFRYKLGIHLTFHQSGVLVLYFKNAKIVETKKYTWDKLKEYDNEM
ncbi:MAG: hypothetical protein IJY46_05050 [Lentisphaeria bacterium]|nr:hypothetical protein [Lentisphaeria bacterium]